MAQVLGASHVHTATPLLLVRVHGFVFIPGVVVTNVGTVLTVHGDLSLPLYANAQTMGINRLRRPGRSVIVGVI